MLINRNKLSQVLYGVDIHAHLSLEQYKEEHRRTDVRVSIINIAEDREHYIKWALIQLQLISVSDDETTDKKLHVDLGAHELSEENDIKVLLSQFIRVRINDKPNKHELHW